MNIAELQIQSLLVLGENVMLDENVIFLPHDQTGEAKVIKIGNNVRIMPSAVICGGVTIGDGAVIEARSSWDSQSMATLLFMAVMLFLMI